MRKPQTIALITAAVINLALLQTAFAAGEQAANQALESVKRRLREIDRKVIEYRINDALRVQLEKEVRVVLGGDEAVELVALRVRNQVEEEVRTAAGTLIADSVSRAIDEAQGINLNDAIREVVSNEVQPLFNQLRVEIQKVRQQLVTMDRDPKRLAVPGSPVLVQ